MVLLLVFSPFLTVCSNLHLPQFFLECFSIAFLFLYDNLENKTQVGTMTHKNPSLCDAVLEKLIISNFFFF